MGEDIVMSIVLCEGLNRKTGFLKLNLFQSLCFFDWHYAVKNILKFKVKDQVSSLEEAVL